MTIQYTKNGQPCDAPNGYNVADYFPGVDAATATESEMKAAYLAVRFQSRGWKIKHDHVADSY